MRRRGDWRATTHQPQRRLRPCRITGVLALDSPACGLDRRAVPPGSKYDVRRRTGGRRGSKTNRTDTDKAALSQTFREAA